MGNNQTKRQSTDRCGDLLTQLAQCVLSTDGYRDILSSISLLRDVANIQQLWLIFFHGIIVSSLSLLSDGRRSISDSQVPRRKFL
jgi:hypothetical protein